MINPLPSKPAWPPTEGDIQFLPATSHRSSRVSTDSAASTDSAGQKVFHFAEDHPFQRSGLSRFFSSNKIRPEEAETDRAPAKKQGLFRRISSVALSIFSKRPESTDSVTPFYLNSVDESPELFRRPAKTNPVTQILQSNEYTTFTKRSDAIWKTILEEEPALSKKIEQFQKEHSQKIGMLTTWPWKSLVNTWGINLTEKCDEDHLSYEEFRDKANQFIDSMCAEAAKQMKLPAVNWFDIGSKGYTSDVDLSMRGVDKEVTPYEAFIYKLLRDTTHNFIFSGLSGVQLDTESYPPVLSKTIDSATMLQTSEYTTTEIAMKLLHRKNDLPSEDWQIFCQNELGAIKDQSTKNTVQEMMSCIGDWHEVMKTDILREVVGDLADTLKPKGLEETALSILKEDPLAYDRAAINYRTPIIMNLAESNNALMKEIKKLETQQGKMSTADQEKHHQMVVKYDFIYKMLVSLLPESTYSGSEWTATLGEQQYIVDASIATKTLKRKLSKGEVGPVHPPTLNEPTAAELSIAASVECQQFMNKTHDIHTGVSQNPEKDLINGSKYLLRMTKNISKAIESCKKQNPHFEMNIDKYLEVATQLERCKRKSILNDVAALKFLTMAIAEKHPEKTSEEIEVGLSDVLKNYHKFLKTDKQFLFETDDKTLSKSELQHAKNFKRVKMNFLVDQLGKLGYIEKDEKKSEITIPGIPKYITNDVEINDILRAMCGYKKKKLELFEKGDNILLNDYRLTTPESIRKFVEEVEDISRQWQNIAFKQKILQPLKDHFWVKNNQNFLKIWSDAKQQVNGNTSC